MTSNIIPIDTAKLKTKRDYALAYAAIGWHVLPVWWIENGACACGKPCNSPGKHPISAKGQNDSTIDADRINQFWHKYPKANIGIHLSQSHMVAIDIDPRNGGMESIERLEDVHGKITSDVLQFSGGGGEHRIFYVPNEIKLPGTLGDGIDLKQNGYILAHPSNHISGGNYEWEGSSDPLEGMAPSPLPDWIRDLGAFAKKEEPQGAYISRLVTNDQVDSLRSALLAIDADDRDTWVKVGTALKTIGNKGWELYYEFSQRSPKFEHHDQLRVWRSFKPKSLNIESIFFWAQQNGWVNMPTTPSVDISQLISKPVEQKPTTATATYCPLEFPVPILNDLMHWMETLEEYPSRMITMQGVLAMVSVLGGRIYKSSNQNDSSLYLMTLARTGKGKGYPAKAIKNILHAANLSNLMQGSGNTSSSAVFSALKRSPCHIQIADEIGKQYSSARKQNNHHNAEALTQLTIAYSDTDSVMQQRNYSTEGARKKEIEERGAQFIAHPSITLFGFATPEQVLNTLTFDDIDDGFLNRQIIVYSDDELLPYRDRQPASPPEKLVSWCKSMRRMGCINGTSLDGVDAFAFDQIPASIVVHIDETPRKMFRAFKDEITFDFKDDRLKVAIRWNENAMRLATGLAIAKNQDSPVITTELAQWAINYVRYHGERLIKIIQDEIAGNDVQRLRNQVLKAIDNAGHDGLLISQLSRFSRLWSQSTVVQQDSALNSLTREKMIFKVEGQASSGRGRKPAPRFYSAKFYSEAEEINCYDKN